VLAQGEIREIPFGRRRRRLRPRCGLCCLDKGARSHLRGVDEEGQGVFRFWLATVPALSLASLACAQSGDPIAEQAAAEFRRQIPAARITIADASTIRVETDNEHAGAFSVSLDRVRAQCGAEPASCAEAIAGYVRQIAGLVRDAAASLSPERLLAVVRSRAYVEMMQRAVQRSGDDAFVAATLAGDLMAVCYFDLPTARRPIGPGDLTELRMDAQEALSRCKANTAAALKPLAARWRELPERGLGILNEAADEPSYLLFPEQWAPLAARLGVLIVAAPGDDVLLYGRGSDAIAIDAMFALARDMHARAQRPMSDKVYRWTPIGWQEVEWPPAPASR
jgi:hypothetical protein